MTRDFAIAIVAAVVVCAAEAKPFRWASQGDPQTIDPHSQNELLTNSVNGQMYETLVNRGKKLEIVPVLATEWQQVDPLTWRFTLRKGVPSWTLTPLRSVKRQVSGSTCCHSVASTGTISSFLPRLTSVSYIWPFTLFVNSSFWL